MIIVFALVLAALIAAGFIGHVYADPQTESYLEARNAYRQNLIDNA